MKTTALIAFLVFGFSIHSVPVSAQSFPCGIPKFGGKGIFVTYFYSTSSDVIATTDCDNIPGLRPVKTGDILSIGAGTTEFSLSKNVAFQKPFATYLALRIPNEGQYYCSTPNEVDAHKLSGRYIDISADGVAHTLTLKDKKINGDSCVFRQCPGFGACN